MQQELVQIKTSRTNTCGLVYNTFETNSPNYVKCTGQVGWGLGGVGFFGKENEDEFPFYSTADISGGYFFDGTNHTISGIHAIALDEKRLCLTGSFEVENMTLSDHVVCAGRVGFGEDKDFTSTMLYGGYNRFEVSGTWGCGELQESDGIFLGGGMEKIKMERAGPSCATISLT